MRSISLITSFFILSVSFADDYVLEWELPDSLRSIEYSRVEFGYDYDNDGGTELIMKNYENSLMHVYDVSTHALIWSYQPSNADLKITFGETFGNITNSETNELIYCSVNNMVTQLVVVNTSTNTENIITSFQGDTWGEIPFFVSDIDLDSKDEIIVTNMGNTVQIWGDGTTGLSNSSGITQPKNFKLSQNYPNPFNPITTIEYEIPQYGNVNVSIYDIKGELVEKLIDGYNTTGKYSIRWKPQNISSGQYFYQISVDGFVQTKKMVLLK